METNSPTLLTDAQQKAVDELVNKRVGQALHDLSYDISKLIEQLMEINEKE